MSDACILIESAAHGGGLITCEISQAYGRDVFTFPGRIGDAYSEGCNNLIRNNGALLIAYRKLADCALDASHQGFRRYELCINHGSSESLAEHAKANIRYVFHRSEEEGLRPKFYITYFHEFRVKSSYSYDVYLLFCGCKVTAFF